MRMHLQDLQDLLSRTSHKAVFARDHQQYKTAQAAVNLTTTSTIASSPATPPALLSSTLPRQSRNAEETQPQPTITTGIRTAHGSLGSLHDQEDYSHDDLTMLPPMQMVFVAPTHDYSSVKEQWLAERRGQRKR
ncbi:hypothetical protein LTS08_007844 [Lithohypha guttulata]|nr:hypothetical protein LTS08_007844 [Lithohypha guttulata]